MQSVLLIEQCVKLMKRTLFCLVLFFSIVHVIGAQARLGSTSKEIRSEFSAKEHGLKSGNFCDGTFYIQITTNLATVIYYFDKSMICCMTLIAPDDIGALNYYVELYNKSYVIISSRKWRAYLENGIADIDLVYPEDGGYYFYLDRC